MQNPFSKIQFYFIFLSFIGLQAQNISIEQWIENTVQPQEDDIVLVDGVELFSQVELPRFYSNRDFEPAWQDLKNRNDLIESLESSIDEGLMPKDYHLDKIKALMKTSESGELSKKEMADMDLLMTDALILYASHLLDGKLDQSKIQSHSL